ncbi:MAG: hypothetical protein AB2609_08850 [Candidatus Thiodiazotropha sp.]
MKLCSRIVVGTGLVLLTLSVAHADYCAVGKIEGNVCKGFVIESCKFVQVDSVKDDNGKLFTVKECYNEVSEYNEGKGRCWINTKSKGGGAISWALNAATQPEFLHKNKNGEYEELDVEYLTFKCVRR